MSEFRKFIWWASAFAVVSVLSVGTAFAGEFDGLPLYVDTNVEDTAVNDSVWQ